MYCTNTTSKCGTDGGGCGQGRILDLRSYLSQNKTTICCEAERTKIGFVDIVSQDEV
jgi:hypothetical protein